MGVYGVRKVRPTQQGANLVGIFGAESHHVTPGQESTEGNLPG